MKFRRLFSILIVACLIMGCLISCSKPEEDKEPTVNELVAKADEAVKNSSYRVTMDMAFTGDETDETTKQIITSLNNVEMLLSTDGNNAEVSYGMEIEYDGIVVAVNMEMISVGNTVYILSEQSVDGEKETVKMKATATEEQREELFGQTGSAATEITDSDFEKVEMKKVDGVYVITCTDIKEESVDKLNSVLDSSAGASSSVSVSNAKLTFEIKDGKYQKATITCDYVMDIDGEKITLGASIDMKYTYEDFDITAPSDAKDYQEIDIDDML